MLEIVPLDADHVTELLPVPVTVAENCCVAPATNEAEVGLIAMETAVGEEVTTTVDVAEFPASAALVAVTV